MKRRSYGWFGVALLLLVNAAHMLWALLPWGGPLEWGFSLAAIGCSGVAIAGVAINSVALRVGASVAYLVAVVALLVGRLVEVMPDYPTAEPRYAAFTAILCWWRPPASSVGQFRRVGSLWHWRVAAW
jgi:hypothetical protein